MDSYPVTDIDPYFLGLTKSNEILGISNFLLVINTPMVSLVLFWSFTRPYSIDSTFIWTVGYISKNS